MSATATIKAPPSTTTKRQREALARYQGEYVLAVEGALQRKLTPQERTDCVIAATRLAEKVARLAWSADPS